MAGCDDLGHRAHACGIRADDSGKADFRPRLELGAVEHHIHPAAKGHARLPGGGEKQFLEFSIVGLAHIGEPGAEPSSLGPIRGLDPEKLMWSSMSIRSPGEKSRLMPPAALVKIIDLGATQPKRPDGKGDFLLGIALVVVKPALHDGHRKAKKASHHQPASVTVNGGNHKTGNLFVGDDDGGFHPPSVIPQAASQDQNRVGGLRSPLKNDAAARRAIS